MKTVFVDVDTQLDFVNPSGALYVPGAERVIEKVGSLNRLAKSAGHTVLSTVDAHGENDAEFASWPPHCIQGTLGQRKPAVTLVGQIVFEKTTTDAFLNPGLAPLLRELNAERYVVYGVVTEICVRFAALGLLRHSGASRVEVVTDAIRQLSDDAMQHFFEEFRAAGGVLVDSATLSR